MRLIQLAGAGKRRCVCLVSDDKLQRINEQTSVYELALAALASGVSLQQFVEQRLSDDSLDYEEIYQGRSEWRILPSVDHPQEPARCLVTGTGLTHKGSAEDRQAMHAADAAPTDSMRMFRSGLEGGRPALGQVGVSPEWFYKGPGTILRGHGEPLHVPDYADDGGEEGELAGVYIIDDGGAPRRIGMTIGNEFSDHRFEKKNYLYLAASKLRNCSIGPELVLDPDYAAVEGEITIERQGKQFWAKSVLTGDEAMSHSLENMEHHHFKHDAHRRPGDLHIHFFGAAVLSFGQGVELAEGDVMQIRFSGFGRPLRNPITISGDAETLVKVNPL